MLETKRMKLADTCIWIELLAGTPTGQRYATVLADLPHLMVSTLVIYELRKWVLQNLDEERADQIMVMLHTATIVSPDESTALHAAELGRRYKLHALDALIYATALAGHAQLVTCDAHFKGLPQVDYTPQLK